MTCKTNLGNGETPCVYTKTVLQFMATLGVLRETPTPPGTVREEGRRVKPLVGDCCHDPLSWVNSVSSSSHAPLYQPAQPLSCPIWVTTTTTTTTTNTSVPTTSTLPPQIALATALLYQHQNHQHHHQPHSTTSPNLCPNKKNRGRAAAKGRRSLTKLARRVKKATRHPPIHHD